MNDFWPVQWPSSVKTDNYDPETLERAAALAVSSLRALTLNRVGPVRVSAQPCGHHQEGTYSAFRAVPGSLVPAATDLRCRCSLRCSCSFSTRVKLIAPVVSIEQVLVEGRPVDPANYTIEGGAYLVSKTDPWPVCGNFTVDYYSGYPVSKEGQYVAGILAEEFLKGMDNPAKCRLPRGVTEINRQGVTISIEAGLFPDGMTGLPEVDAFIYLWNPNGLKTRPRVYSPDLQKSGVSW